MSVTLIGNITVREPGEKLFAISSDKAPFFEFGRRDGDDYWLEGLIIRDEFIFNGRLFLPEPATNFGTVIDNFPVGPAPAGWTKRPRVDEPGYELVDASGTILLGYRVAGDYCITTVNIFAKDGSLVAEALSDELRVLRMPAIIGYVTLA